MNWSHTFSETRVNWVIYTKWINREVNDQSSCDFKSCSVKKPHLHAQLNWRPTQTNRLQFTSPLNYGSVREEQEKTYITYIS